MPLLQSDRLLLRPPERGDAAKIAKWLGDIEVARNTVSVPHPFTLIDAEAMIAAADDMRAKGEAFHFVMVHRATGLRAPGVAAMFTVSMSSSLVPTLPICGKVKVMIWPA